MFDMLSETNMPRCQAIDIPTDLNSKLLPNPRKLLENPGQYRRLVRKLNSLTATRLDIAFTKCCEYLL